jgi:hypothetical protein
MLIGINISTTAVAQFSGGDGTELNPYKISSKADMEQLANNEVI